VAGRLGAFRPRYYLRAAAHWAHAYITGPQDAADSPEPLRRKWVAHYELFARLVGPGHSTTLQVTRSALLGDIRKQL